MVSQVSIVKTLVLAAACLLANSSLADDWDSLQFRLSPSSPTDGETFDLRAFHWFTDSGYLPLSQSLEVDGFDITVRALIQDQHSRPGMMFATVMTPGGAFFNDYGPLSAGTYNVNAEIYLTPWPFTAGGSLINSGSMQFTVTGVGTDQTVAGDYDGNNIVDAADYIIWRKRLNGSSSSADGNDDGHIDESDYTIWRSQFGAPPGNAGAGSGAIPEPASWVLLILGTAISCGVIGRAR